MTEQHGDSESSSIKVKISVFGEEKVGKSSVLRAYNGETFSKIYKPTDGVDVIEKIVTMPSKLTYEMKIWDVSGNHCKDMPERYIRDCNGVILVYDITNQETLSKLENLITTFESSSKLQWDKWGKVLVGNKSDLESERSVASHKAQMYADKLRIPFLEVSALDKTNIDMLFKILLNEIKRRNKMRPVWWKRD